MGRSRTTQRVNIKAVIGTVVVVLVLVGGGFLAANALQDRVKSEVLSQSETLAEGDKGWMALRHLERYLAKNPEDIEVLDRYCRLLSEAVLESGDQGRLTQAISNNERLLRLDPEGLRATDPQQNRRWLTELLIRQTDFELARYSRVGSTAMNIEATWLNRYAAAANVAADLIERGADDAEAYRLLGMAQEGKAGESRPATDAINSYLEALTRDRTDVKSAIRLARIYRDRNNDPETADGVLDDLVEAAPEDTEAWLARFEFYRASANRELANQALERAAQLAPDQPDVILAASSNAQEQGKLDEARALLDQLPEASRNSSRVALQRASIHTQDGKLSEADEVLGEALSKNQGTNTELLRERILIKVELGDLVEAKPLLERYQGLIQKEDLPNYHYLLGRYFHKGGQPDRAIAEFNKADKNLLPKFRSTLLVERGRSKLLLGQNAEATDDFQAAIDLDPQNPQARLAMAGAMAAQVGIDRALTDLRGAIVRLPDSIELRVYQLQLMISSLASQPASSRSWSSFDSALNDARSRPGIGNQPALALLEAQRLLLESRPAAALARLEQAVETHPRSEALWRARAELLLRQGKLEEALEVLDVASAPEAAGDRAGFRIFEAQILSQLGKGREAIEVLAEGASTLPVEQRPDLLRVLGQMHIARGQFGEARNALTAWKRLQPGSAAPLLALLELAVETNDTKAAEEALRELGEEKGLPYQLGRAEYLIRIPGDDQVARINQALEVLKPILDDSPEKPALAPDLAAALLLRGRAYRQLGELEEGNDGGLDSFRAAERDLLAAWERGERRAASPLIDVLVRLDRFGEIDQLPRRSSGDSGFDPELDRLTAEACLKHGRLDRAEEFVERAGQAPSANTPQFAAWRLAMFDRLGRTAQVEQSLRAQADSRRDAASWAALIRYQASRGQRDAAEQSIAEMKRVVQDERLELLEAQALEAIGDIQAAEAAYQAAIDAQPDDPTTLIIASRFDRSLGRPVLALERAERAVTADPSSRPAIRFRALLLSELAEDAEGWQAAWDSLGAEEDDRSAPEDRLARAIVLARHPEAARREEAVDRLEALVGDQPSGDALATAARETLARLLLQQGRAERAVEVSAVSAVSGTNPTAVALYARALIDADQLDEASRQIDRLRNISPNAEPLPELDLLLVERRAEAGSIAEELAGAYFDSEAKAQPSAVATFRRLTQLGDSAIEPAERVGRDLAERFPGVSWMPSQWFAARGLYADSLEMAGPAIDADDPNAVFQASRAVLTVIDRSKAAPEFMETAAELIERAASRSDLPATKAVLAMLRHFQGRTDPARFDDEIRLYRELLQSEPDNVIYLNNLAWALSVTADQADEALELIDRALETLDVRIPELLDTRGVILIQLERLDEAVATLDEVVAERPNSPLYAFHLALAHSEAGNADAAKTSFARALELGLTADDVEPSERPAFEDLQSL